MRTRSLPDSARLPRRRPFFSALPPAPLAPLLLALALPAPAHLAAADTELGAPPAVVIPSENWEARQLLTDTIAAPVREAAAAPARLVRQESGAARVQFRTSVQGGSVYLVFANPAHGRYPLDSAGSFIIKRSLFDGSFTQVKVFVQDGPGTYIRIFPDGERTLLDAWLFGQPFQTGIVIPIPFDRVLTAPLSSIIEWSSRAVDWPLMLSPSPGAADERLQAMVRTLESRLPALRDMDDGAMDSSGRLVTIATGLSAGKGGFNCSGFAKWVADGLYEPLTGHPMDIGPLKSRDSGREHAWAARFEEELDPWFGLDWSRGLARAVTQAQTGVAPSDEQIDVRDSDHIPYIRDVGYPVSKLEYVLYFLARRDPGTLYIGSVNAPSAAVSEGTPTLRQHHHVIVLFPYFDRDGAFQVVVMERNLQTSLSSLSRRYGSEYVQLERISSEGTFRPPQIE